MKRVQVGGGEEEKKEEFFFFLVLLFVFFYIRKEENKKKKKNIVNTIVVVKRVQRAREEDAPGAVVESDLWSSMKCAQLYATKYYFFEECISWCILIYYYYFRMYNMFEVLLVLNLPSLVTSCPRVQFISPSSTASNLYCIL